jgi:NAD+ kinase
MPRKETATSRPDATRPGSRAGAASRISRVLVLADGRKDEIHALLGRLEPWLRTRVESLEVEPDARGFYRARLESRGGAGPRPDLVVVLGGDGAILGAVRAFADAPVPTLGINFGRVGFLAAAEAGHWEEALREILDGEAVVEPRTRLLAELETAATRELPDGARVRAVALNDVVVTRGAYQGLLELSLSIGDEWVTNYRADGLIVSTASGSTAYSLAAGGPILAPTMQDLVLTPISPQSLSHRTILLPGSSELRLSITSASGITTLVVDGQGFYPMQQGAEVRLRRHPEPYPLLARPGEDFFKRLRERLGWRGSIESDAFPPARDIDPAAGGVL